MDTKRCSKCGEVKPLSEFQPDKSKKSGYKSQCKSCIANNPKRKEYLKNYRENNPEYFREKHAEWRARNREKIKEQCKERRLKNPDYMRNYYVKNKDKILSYCKEYRESEHGKAVIKARNQTEKVKGYKSYKRHITRAKIKSGDKDITLSKLFARDNGICALCGEPCDFEDYTTRDGLTIVGNKYPSIDHIKPLSKGGTHTWNNVQLAHKQCNSIKKDREADEVSFLIK